MLTLAKSVNFGTTKTGLSTIGYTLVNPDGSVYQARTTTGVVELLAGSGIYGTSMNLPLGVSITIAWDSGDGSAAYYAAENFDSRMYQGSGGGVAFMAKPIKGAEPWTKTEKKKISDNLKRIMEGILTSHSKTDTLADGIAHSFRALREGELKILVERKIDFAPLELAIADLKENISKSKNADIDFSQVDKKLDVVKSLVEKQSEFLEPLVDGMSALIESQQASIVQGETR